MKFLERIVCRSAWMALCIALFSSSAMAQTITQHIWERKFAEVEAQMQAHLRDYKSGKITDTEYGKRYKPFDTDSLELEPLLSEWIKKYPKSYSARAARGTHYRSVAQAKRGNKWARDTTEVQFENFAKYLKLAQDDFKESIRLDDKPTYSYDNLIDIARGLGSGEQQKYLTAAVAIDPKALQPRLTYLYTLTPKWGGSIHLMDAFVTQSKSSAMSEDDKLLVEAVAYWYKADDANIREDYKQAVSYFKRSYHLRPRDAWRLLDAAKAAENGNLQDQALAVYDELLMGHPKNIRALERRGFLHETHYKNLPKALSDYLAAAAAGGSWAQNRVGWWYFTGHGVGKDLKLAEKYFRLAAEQGNDSAKNNLKLMAGDKQ